MIIEATKNNTSKVIFDLPGMTEAEAIKYARESVRKTIKANLNKRPYGWKYKIK